MYSASNEPTQITHEDDRTATYTDEIRNGCSLLTGTAADDGASVRYAYSNTGAVDGLPHYITHALVRGSRTYTIRQEAGTTIKAAETIKAADVSCTYDNHVTLVSAAIAGKALRYHSISCRMWTSAISLPALSRPHGRWATAMLPMHPCSTCLSRMMTAPMPPPA